MQTTLLAVGLGVFVYVIQRWRDAQRVELTTDPALDQAGVGRKLAVIQRLGYLCLIMTILMLVLALMPIIELQLYFRRWVPDETLVNLASVMFAVTGGSIAIMAAQRR